MRFWSLVFLAIAVLAVVVSASDGTEPPTVARALFGIALLVFCVMLIVKYRDHDRDGHSDQ